jgi:DNA-binding MarR family transcriptional regulator
MSSRDGVDQVVEQWRRERPDLDASLMAVPGRLLRVAKHLERRLEAVLEPHGLNVCQFDLLATLRRAGEPFQLAPKQLIACSMLSSGAMTNRIDRLEAKGLVKRDDDPDDRRGFLISLTPRGRKLVDRVLDDRLAEARANVAPLDEKEVRALDGALRKMLIAFEGAGETA